MTDKSAVLIYPGDFLQPIFEATALRRGAPAIAFVIYRPRCFGPPDRDSHPPRFRIVKTRLYRTHPVDAWSSYGVEWPVIYHFLGVRPDIPKGEVSVIPSLPPTWPTLSAQNLRISHASLSASATHNWNRYTTVVSAPFGFRIHIGYALPAKSILAEVTLNGRPASYEIRDTDRGREVIVTSNSGQPLQLILIVQ